METPAPPPTVLELLSSLVTAWRNLASYPPGHPARASALATAHARLGAHLAHSSPLVLGITRDALVSGEKKVEATHVRAFARALYRRNGGVLRIEEDVEPRELEAFLALLGDTGPARDRPLTAEMLHDAGVRHIELAPIDYSAVVTTSDLETPSGEDTALWDGLMKMHGGWVLELDIESFFDTMVHEHLRNFLDRRVRDGVLRRTINKWLKAGVLEAGELRYEDAGTPQGGVISPLLANVYLHEVLDTWFETEVKPRLQGQAFLIRYADDAALVFSSEDDARRVMAALPERFGTYGLALHPEKTRLVKFIQPRRNDTPKDADSGSFDLLGFTHFWGKSRKDSWVVKRQTARGRFGRALKRVSQWCRKHLHDKIAKQHEHLVRVLRGHYGYFGITGNANALSAFLYEVTQVWQKWLHRRTGCGAMPWPRFMRVLKRYPLPPPRVVHSVYRT